MREAELKHGRVCMLAVVGYIVVDKGLRAPGAEKLVAATSSFTAHDAAVQSGHMWALLLACGLFEIVGAGAIASTLNGGDRSYPRRHRGVRPVALREARRRARPGDPTF